MELTSEHRFRLDEIITLISISDDFTIAFVRCNEPILCNALSTEIGHRTHNDIFIYNIRMSENSTNLLQLLNDAVNSEQYNSQIKDNKRIVFFIFGLDKAVIKKNRQGKSEALMLLNMMREDFRNIKHTLIIWINKASLSLILQEAQDFFSWRTTVFEFDTEHEKTTRPTTDFGDTDLVFLTKNELEDRWNYYCGLLEEYKEKGIYDAYKISDWNLQLGIIKLLMGYAEESVKYFEESLVILREIGDRRSEGICLSNLGNAYSDLGHVEKAIDYFDQALAISREIGDRHGEGGHLNNLGSAYSHLGEVEKAIEYYEQALAISKEIGDRRNEGKHLGNLGNAFNHLGEVEKAIDYYKQGLAISKEFGNRRSEGAHLGNLGSAYTHLGEVEKAIDYFDQALAISKEIGDRRSEGVHLGNLGSAYNDLSEVEKAIDYFDQALAISKEIRYRRGEGISLGNLGSAYSDLGQTEKAIGYYEKALTIGKEIKNPKIIGFFEKKLDSIKHSLNRKI